MTDVGSDAWQSYRLSELIYRRDDDFTFRIREMAKRAVESDSTYVGGTYFVYSPHGGSGISLDTDETGRVEWTEVLVRLIPRLERYPEAATIIAEEMLMHKIGRSL